MSDETMCLGASGLAGLAQQVLGEWQAGPGAEAEELDTCECCGELLGFEDRREREMAEQWAAGVAENARLEALRVGGWDCGWPGSRQVYADTEATGWMRTRGLDPLRSEDINLDV